MLNKMQQMGLDTDIVKIIEKKVTSYKNIDNQMDDLADLLKEGLEMLNKLAENLKIDLEH